MTDSNLKTLEQIENELEFASYDPNEKMVYSKELREEAKKWVEELYSKQRTFQTFDAQGQINWIKHFFNLE